MRLMMPGVPQVVVKQRSKSRCTPSGPDGYALSPSVNTTLVSPATLSARTTLSASRAVATSPLVPQTAMSPAPTITGAEAITSSLPFAPGRVAGAFSPREQARTRTATSQRRFNVPVQLQSLEREPDLRHHVIVLAVREQQLDTDPRIERSDPESSTRRLVPPSRRISVYVHPAGVGEPDQSNIKRQNEGESCDWHAQLRRAVQGCITGVPLLLLCSESL